MRIIENLTFEGAGMFGITYVGALSVLQTNGILDTVKRYSGTSSGSIVATLLAINCTVDQIEDIFLDTDWASFLDTKCCCCGIINIFYKYGYNIGKRKEISIKRILKEYTGNSNITFKQIYDIYKKELYITAVNLNLKIPVYFSHKYSPDMCVWKAIQMSTAFPFVFTPVKHDGHYYVDGGIMENYPIEVFDDKTKSLGFKIISSDTEINVPTLYSFTTCILSATLKALDDKDTHPYYEETIFIKIPKQGLLTSVLEIDKIIINHKEYYDYGVNAVKTFIKN
jgi:NTE family protein